MIYKDKPNQDIVPMKIPPEVTEIIRQLGLIVETYSNIVSSLSKPILIVNKDKEV